MKTQISIKKGISLLLAGLLCVQLLPLTSATAAEQTFDFTKISNPSSTDITSPDGMEIGGDRGNSYAWSMAQTDKYVWIGMNRQCLTVSAMQILQALGLSPDQYSTVLNVLTGGKLPADVETMQDQKPVIMRYNKSTGELQKVYESPAAFTMPDGTVMGEDYGFRVAKEYKGSVYFGSLGAGLGQHRVLRFDDSMKTGDQPEIVYELPMQGSQTSIRAMEVYNDELYIGTISATNQVQILKSKDPKKNNWQVVANTNDFDNLVKAGENAIAGGGVFDLVKYNDYLYATIVTSDTPSPTNGVKYSGWGLYKGKPDSNGKWTWSPVVSSATGSKYPLGMGVDINTVSTPYVFDGKLYIGTFNEPVHAMMQLFLNGSVDAMYNSLQTTTHLYSFDKNDNAEMIVGNTNALFPQGSKSGLKAGYTNEQMPNSTLYTWRMEEHNGQLYIGTFDAYALYRMIAVLPLNDILDISDQAQNVNEKARIANTKAKASDSLKNAINDWSNVVETIDTLNVIPKDTQAPMKEQTQTKNETSLTDKAPQAVTPTPEVSTPITTIANVENNATLAAHPVTEPASKAILQEPELTKIPDQEPVAPIMANINTATAQAQDIQTLSTNVLCVQDTVNKIKELLTKVPTEQIVSSLKQLISDTNKTIDLILAHSKYLPNDVIATVNNMKMVLSMVENLLNNFNFHEYFDICKTLTQSEIRNDAGADLFVLTNDGATIKTVTNNGFNNQYNYGVRTLSSIGDKLIVGTANPFYGSQLWSVDDGTRPSAKLEPSMPVQPAAPLEPSIPIQPAAPLEPSITIIPATTLQPSLPMNPKQEIENLESKEIQTNINTGDTHKTGSLMTMTIISLVALSGISFKRRKTAKK